MVWVRSRGGAKDVDKGARLELWERCGKRMIFLEHYLQSLSYTVTEGARKVITLLRSIIFYLYEY